MSNVAVKLNKLQDTIFQIELAIENTTDRKYETELARKKSKLVKQVKKLARKVNDEAHSSSGSEPDHRQWR